MIGRLPQTRRTKSSIVVTPISADPDLAAMGNTPSSSSSSAIAAPETDRRVHGDGGAYVGGDWVSIEDCAKQFNIKNGSSMPCVGDCRTCPRSSSRHSAAKPDGTYDVVIIGAGCIGSAIARELSKTTASVLLLEAADDVTQGATKGNSGALPVLLAPPRSHGAPRARHAPPVRAYSCPRNHGVPRERHCARIRGRRRVG